MEHRAFMHHSLVRVAAVIAAFGSCTDATGTVCTDEARPGVVVHVLDATSGVGLSGASGTVREGEYVETLQGMQTMLAGAYERAGTYRVEVTRPDYQPWLQEDVQVTRDRCHVRTVTLDARLTPLP